MNSSVRVCAGVVVALCLIGTPGYGDFTFKDEGGSVVVADRGTPVLVYRYARAEGVAGPTCAIHPLYDYRGAVLTAGPSVENPIEWGLFWRWPDCRLSGRDVDLWNERGVRKEFERWMVVEEDDESAVLELQNVWVLEDSGEGQILETVRMVIWPSVRRERRIDLAISLRNVGSGIVRIGGRSGLGGLFFRAEPTKAPFTFEAIGGTLKKDVPVTVETPWVDLSYRDDRSFRYSGVAIFLHPENANVAPVRASTDPSGLMGAYVDVEGGIVLGPGQGFELKYGVFTHPGQGPVANLEKHYQKFLSAWK